MSSISSLFSAARHAARVLPRHVRKMSVLSIRTTKTVSIMSQAGPYPFLLAKSPGPVAPSNLCQYTGVSYAGTQVASFSSAAAATADTVK
jgi:hypothetical protein